MRLIEGGQFCAKCTHITSFKFVQIALEHQDAICLAAQLGMHFTLCGCFENYRGLAAANPAILLWFRPSLSKQMVQHIVNVWFWKFSYLKFQLDMSGLKSGNSDRKGKDALFLHSVNHDAMQPKDGLHFMLGTLQDIITDTHTSEQNQQTFLYASFLYANTFLTFKSNKFRPVLCRLSKGIFWNIRK